MQAAITENAFVCEVAEVAPWKFFMLFLFRMNGKLAWSFQFLTGLDGYSISYTSTENKGLGKGENFL